MEFAPGICSDLGLDLPFSAVIPWGKDAGSAPRDAASPFPALPEECARWRQ